MRPFGSPFSLCPIVFFGAGFAEAHRFPPRPSPTRQRLLSEVRFVEMAEDEKEIKATSPRGTDWEVVSLTASTYAFAPGPKGFDPPDESKETKINKSEQPSSDAMFMSGHFVFPPSEHKNLLLESNFSEICNEPGGQDVKPSDLEGDGPNKTNQDKWKTKLDDELHGIEFFDKGKGVTVHNVELGEGKKLEGLALVGDEQVIYGAPEFGAFHAETNISQSVLCDDSFDIPEPSAPSIKHVDSPVDYTNTSKSNEESKHGVSGPPCETWWKRHAISLYSHVKEENKFWFVVGATAVMGLVILGQRWRREMLQLQQLKFQSTINSERMSWMAGPINRFKGVLIGGHQRSSLIRGGATSNHLSV